MPLDVLVIDDNPGDGRLLQEVTSGSAVPVRVTVAATSEQAIAKLTDPEYKPNLVILDLNMPKTPGLSLLERFPGNDVPVVIFSSSWNQAEVQRALSLGARDCFQKPIDLDQFTEAVWTMIWKWGVLRKHETAREAAATL